MTSFFIKIHVRIATLITALEADFEYNIKDVVDDRVNSNIMEIEMGQNCVGPYGLLHKGISVQLLYVGFLIIKV